MQPTLTLKTGEQKNPPGAIFQQASWVSGDPASLALDATVACIFDLGGLWRQYSDMLVSVTGTQAMDSITPSASDDGATATVPLPGSAADGSLTLTLASAGTVQGLTKVVSRYLIVTIVNGGAAQGATAAVRVVAFGED